MAAGIELATAYVSLSISGQDIAPQARRQLQAVENESDRAGKASGKKFSAGMGGALKSLGPLFGGVLAGIGFGAVSSGLKDVVGEAREAQKVGALTANVIKTTGGAAKISAKQVGDLSEAISNKTGIDDEAVQTGANLLLTFKNVRNEAGKGSDVFNRATKSAVDLSASGFGSVESSSKMLGKALNDPLKGISALGRAGVTFTAGQKKQIEGMVKAGDVLGAQKIILAEVESQVGGAAAASATAGEKASVSMGNLKETLGTALLPVIDKVSTVFTEKLAPAIGGFLTGMEDGTGAGGRFKEILTSVWTAGVDVVDFAQKYSDILVPVAGGILAVVGAMKIWSAVTKIATGVQTLFNIVMMANPIGLVVLALVALGTGLVIAYKKSETFRAVVDGAFKGVSTAASFMWDKVLKPTFRFITEAFLNVAGAIIDGAARAFGWVPGLGGKLKTAATAFAKFKANVNASLDGINDKTVTVGVKFQAGNRLTSSNSQKSGKNGFNTGGGYATGGILPGYTPGRDVHSFYSPTGGQLDLSGGEPIMRPEFGRVVGSGWVNAANQAARLGGVGGVQRFLGAQRFASGGVYARTPSRRGIDEGVDGATLKLAAANAKQIQSLYGPTATGGPGMGWRAQAVWAKANIPGVVITSTLRSGNPLSDHDKGRAIDLAGGPGLSRIFDIIKGAFGVSAIRSLYYSPKGDRQVRFNRESNTPGHIYSTHFDHNHWAMKRGGVIPSIKPTLYDKGGWLNTGTTVVQNNTGKREYVTPDRADVGVSIEDLRDAMSGLTVVMDGEPVGRLVSKHQSRARQNGGAQWP